MTESRWQRWSRKKAEAGKMTEPPSSPSPDTAELPSEGSPEESPEERELAINETLPERDVLEKYGLPDPESIDIGTDVTGFMRKEIPELLRRKALRRLWRSNPVLAVLDGLNDYDEDFTAAATAGQTVKTVYKVGQGLIEKVHGVNEPTQAQVGQPEDRAGIPEPVSSEITSAPEPQQGPGQEDTSRRSETPDDPSADTENNAREDEPEPEPDPRFRPRMRFGY